MVQCQCSSSFVKSYNCILSLADNVSKPNIHLFGSIVSKILLDGFGPSPYCVRSSSEEFSLVERCCQAFGNTVSLSHGNLTSFSALLMSQYFNNLNLGIIIFS